MKIGFLITARLKSTRLPKKLMLTLNGYTVIERVIQRAKQVVEPEKIILCTSTKYQDYPLVKTAVENNIYYYNGDSNDVLQRLMDAAKFFGFDYFIGITGDNPLFSIEYAKLIKEIIQKDPSLDYIYSSKLPIGLNIYGLKIKALETVCSVKKIIDTEIWGPLINRSEIFNVKEIDVDSNHIRENYRLTLDEKSDYELIKIIYEHYKKDQILNISDIFYLMDDDRELSIKNSNVVQRKLDSSTLEKIDNYYNNNKDHILQMKSNIYQT